MQLRLQNVPESNFTSRLSHTTHMARKKYVRVCSCKKKITDSVLKCSTGMLLSENSAPFKQTSSFDGLTYDFVDKKLTENAGGSWYV